MRSREDERKSVPTGYGPGLPRVSRRPSRCALWGPSCGAHRHTPRGYARRARHGSGRVRCGRGGSRAAPRLTATVHAGVPHARRRGWPMHGDAPDPRRPGAIGRPGRARDSRIPPSRLVRLAAPPPAFPRQRRFAFRESGYPKAASVRLSAQPRAASRRLAPIHITGRQCGSTSYCTPTARAARESDHRWRP